MIAEYREELAELDTAMRWDLWLTGTAVMLLMIGAFAGVDPLLFGGFGLFAISYLPPLVLRWRQRRKGR